MLELIAVIVILIEAIAIGALIAYVKKLRQRPDFTVFQALQKEATKAKKDHEAVQKAFESYRTRRDILIISSKDPIDVDAVLAMAATAVESGEGIYGTASNVEIFISAAYAVPQDAEFPPHLRQQIFGNRTMWAVWAGRMPNSLKKITDGDA